MYAAGASQTFEAMRRTLEGGRYEEERRTIHSGHSCGPCLEYASRGWVPTGTLPNPGEHCECKSNCRCEMQHRLRRA
jgi:hypothetical protein